MRKLNVATRLTVTLSIISQLVFMWMPGRNPLPYYICTGSFPVSQIPLNTPVKINVPVMALLTMSSCTHLYTAVQMKKFKKEEVLQSHKKNSSGSCFNKLKSFKDENICLLLKCCLAFLFSCHKVRFVKLIPG